MKLQKPAALLTAAFLLLGSSAAAFPAAAESDRTDFTVGFDAEFPPYGYQDESGEYRYVAHTVISTAPEGDALDRVYKYAREHGDEAPKVIGWDFPRLSVEQINVFRMHGYTAAWILPDGVNPDGLEIKAQAAHRYAAIHIERLYDNPFSTIPGAYHTLGDYMRTNGLAHVQNEVIPCFETDGESMDVYLACK